ncbi:hypothetical protein ASF45_27840 [Pseudorhodoferax sp. Leaf265]|nr:hypothetical protein ASF45_27840 [Pseudorhodoferax sp. Leaf265]
MMWWSRMVSLSNRWRGVEFAAWTALLMGVLSVVVFGWVTAGTGPGRDVPSLLYPYLAAASVFVTTCVWILMAARVEADPSQIFPEHFRLARRWALWTFALTTVVLSLSGLAGEPGANAVRSLSNYMFRTVNWLTAPLVQRFALPFAVVTALGNALALSTLVYIGTLCNAIVLAATHTVRGGRDPVGRTALHLRSLIHRLHRYLIMASALMVTSTLTLYLFFGVAAQIQEAAASGTVLPQASSFALLCAPKQPDDAGQTCTLTAASSPNEKSKRSSSPAYMALVCGLSFTGVLFVLFNACNAALDDRILRLARNAHALQGGRFSMKTFHEQYGLDGTGLHGHIMQGLAVTAPALTGLLTLLSS